ncbi:thermonuclease family protein [Singulisphaera sp. PoT]|uniref:thermonuclease family protein n=1 Tax=Singulisphaera sp. PoT TaxID=3411797 RepID=UPI003BF55016
MSRLFAIALMFLTIPACARPDYGARVVGVSDGDTITVLTANKTRQRIRLYGVDAPETRQDFGSKAKRVASAMCFGKTVTIRPHDKDRYGRVVAEVILPDGRNLGREMVSQGLAWWYRQYAPSDNDLYRRQSYARKKRLGLWSQRNPIPPWEYRKARRPQTANPRTASRSRR